MNWISLSLALSALISIDWHFRHAYIQFNIHRRFHRLKISRPISLYSIEIILWLSDKSTDWWHFLFIWILWPQKKIVFKIAINLNACSWNLSYRLLFESVGAEKTTTLLICKSTFNETFSFGHINIARAYTILLSSPISKFIY